MAKNKMTKDIEKHWQIKIWLDHDLVKINIVNNSNELIANQMIPNMFLRAFEFYYPENLNIFKKHGNKNINNFKGKIKLSAIAVNEDLMDEIKKVIEEVKTMEMIPI